MDLIMIHRHDWITCCEIDWITMQQRQVIDWITMMLQRQVDITMLQVLGQVTDEIQT